MATSNPHEKSSRKGTSKDRPQTYNLNGKKKKGFRNRKIYNVKKIENF